MRSKIPGLLAFGLIGWAGLHCSIADAATNEIGSSGLYTSLNDNALLLLLVSFLGKTVFDFGRWFVLKYIIGRQDATEASVEKLKKELLEEIRKLSEKIPDEDHVKTYVRLAVLEELRSGRGRRPN